jgi:hypothetical protein
MAEQPSKIDTLSEIVLLLLVLFCAALVILELATNVMAVAK